jgi:hypothetical protein
MKHSAIRSHLSCIANNLGWSKQALRLEALRADHCPSREFILEHFRSHPAIESLLCDCEQACVAMRDAFNRRDLGGLVTATQARTVCREKLVAALNGLSQAAPAWQPG